MGKANGYVALLSKDRMTLFLACVEEEQRFAEPVRDFQHSRNVPLVCFAVSGRKVTHIALGRRGTGAGTGLRTLNFDKSEKLPSPLPFAQIFKLLPKRNMASVEKRFNGSTLGPTDLSEIRPDE